MPPADAPGPCNEPGDEQENCDQLSENQIKEFQNLEEELLVIAAGKTFSIFWEIIKGSTWSCDLPTLDTWHFVNTRNKKSRKIENWQVF